MAQLLMQWMNLAHKADTACQDKPNEQRAVRCDDYVLKGREESMRHLLMQMNQLKHF